MEIDPQGKPVHPTGEPNIRGIKMREYYAAHCPITMRDAFVVWSSEKALASGVMAQDLRDAKERAAFFQWWAQMRFEYADAMAEENRSALKG